MNTADEYSSTALLPIFKSEIRGDMQPGPVFFELAQELGQDTSDILKFWIEEVKRVFAARKR